MTDTTPVLPDKGELERLQLHLTNEKLKVETAKLAHETQPERWWLKLARNVLALGGIATVVATVYGIWDSYNKTIDDRDRARVATQRTRFEDAIKRLESPSTISKLVGVSVLSGYLNAADKDVHRQILFTFSSLMATEKDFQTQAAVIDLMASIPNADIRPADWTYFQEMLVSQSRALMAKSDLARARFLTGSSSASDDERAAGTLGKLIALLARKGVVADYPDYRGIYCKQCDFRGAAFPQYVDFTNAVLEGANFSWATLPHAIFDNADLIDASFVEADLRNARLRSVDEKQLSNADRRNDRVPVGSWSAYLHARVETVKFRAQLFMAMPDFSCANLAGADFGGHALFPGVLKLRRLYKATTDGPIPEWRSDVPAWIKNQASREPDGYEFDAIEVYPPSFFRANLKGANLERAKFFFLLGEETPHQRLIGNGTGYPLADLMLWFWQAELLPDRMMPAEKSPRPEDRSDGAREQVERLRRGISRIFREAIVDDAKLPEAIRAVLSGKDDLRGMGLGKSEGGCKPRGG